MFTHTLSYVFQIHSIVTIQNTKYACAKAFKCCQKDVGVPISQNFQKFQDCGTFLRNVCVQWYGIVGKS